MSNVAGIIMPLHFYLFIFLSSVPVQMYLCQFLYAVSISCLFASTVILVSRNPRKTITSIFEPTRRKHHQSHRSRNRETPCGIQDHHKYAIFHPIVNRRDTARFLSPRALSARCSSINACAANASCVKIFSSLGGETLRRFVITGWLVEEASDGHP